MNDLYVTADQVVPSDRIVINGQWHSVTGVIVDDFRVGKPINLRVDPPAAGGLILFGYSGTAMVRVRPTPDRTEGHPYR